MVAVESCLYDSVLKSGVPGRICVSRAIPPNNRASASRPCFSSGGSSWSASLEQALPTTPPVVGAISILL